MTPDTITLQADALRDVGAMPPLTRAPCVVDDVISTIRASRAELAAALALPLHCEVPADARYVVAWSDEPLRVVSAALIATWWPNAPLERAKVQRLRVGGAYIDPDTENGVPVCVVVRIS